MKPGDIVLVRSTGILPRLIRLGERIHLKGAGNRWSHVAILEMTSPVHDLDWVTIEAQGRGVVRSTLLAHPDRRVVDAGLADEDRAQLIEFARSCVGDRYGFMTLASIVFDLLTPNFLTFRSPRTFICSELAARALEHGGWVSPEVDTSRVMPSDIATWLLSPVS